MKIIDFKIHPFLTFLQVMRTDGRVTDMTIASFMDGLIMRMDGYGEVRHDSVAKMVFTPSNYGRCKILPYDRYLNEVLGNEVVLETLDEIFKKEKAVWTALPAKAA